MSLYRIGTEAGSGGVGGAMDLQTLGLRRRGLGAPDTEAPSGTTTAPHQFQVILDRVSKWIPAETLVIYLPGVALLVDPSVVFLVVMAVATPLFTILAAFASGGRIATRVWVGALLSGIAFVVWSLSVPSSGWQQIPAIHENPGAVAIAAAIIGVCFALVAEGIDRRVAHSGR